MLESARVEVEAKLVHSLQGKVEHPTPAFCPGSAGDLCWLFFFSYLPGSGEQQPPPPWAV